MNLHFLVSSAPDVTFLNSVLQPNPSYCVCMVVGHGGKKGKQGGAGCFSSAEETLWHHQPAFLGKQDEKNSLMNDLSSAGEKTLQKHNSFFLLHQPALMLLRGRLCLSAVASGYLLSLHRRVLSNRLVFSPFPCTSPCPSEFFLPPLCKG